LTSYSGERRFAIDAQMKRFQFEFTMNDAPRLGGEADNSSPNTVWLDNLSAVAK